MSEANVQLVRELQPSGVDMVTATRGSFNDVPPSAFTEDFESVFIAPSVTQDPRGGVDGLIAGWDDWLEAWERYEMEAEEEPADEEPTDEEPTKPVDEDDV